MTDQDDKKAGSTIPRNDLVTHLSREIETHSKLMMDWRARASFYWLLGPFVVIGSMSIATRQIPRIENLDGTGWVAAVVAAGCFLGMAYLGAIMEEHLWEQCNIWRRTIVKLTTIDTVAITEADFAIKQRVVPGYMIAHVLLLVAFLASIALASRLVAVGPDTPGSGAQVGSEFTIMKTRPQ